MRPSQELRQPALQTSRRNFLASLLRLEWHRRSFTQAASSQNRHEELFRDCECVPRPLCARPAYAELQDFSGVVSRWSKHRRRFIEPGQAASLQNKIMRFVILLGGARRGSTAAGRRRCEFRGRACSSADLRSGLFKSSRSGYPTASQREASRVCRVSRRSFLTRFPLTARRQPLVAQVSPSSMVVLRGPSLARAQNGGDGSIFFSFFDALVCAHPGR
jgi:hypothetical protein